MYRALRFRVIHVTAGGAGGCFKIVFKLLSLRMNRKLLSPEELVTVRALIKRHLCTMYEVKRGVVYLLFKHWCYIRPEADAGRIKLFVNKKLKDGYYYLTEI
jgi:hypothetical protein